MVVGVIRVFADAEPIDLGKARMRFFDAQF